MPPKRPTRPRTQDAASVHTWREAAYTWPCSHCPCTTNLRGLMRPICSHCGHEHQPATATEDSLCPKP